MQILFALTLLLSATLLFIVEPMFAKMVLPYLGGSPSVWNTCLVFYQAALLAGYMYAHWSVQWLGVRRQAAVHLLLLALPWLILPIGIAAGWSPPAESSPIPSLLKLLALSVGLPFFCISATAPLVQAWFAASGHRSSKDPYFLYAASNLGSLLGLAAYPLVIESHLTLAQQSRWWTYGFAGLTALLACCAAALWMTRNRPASAAVTPVEAPPADGPVVLDDAPLTWSRRLWWLALALVPSSLLLGVTTYIQVDMAAVPFLWALPLGLYLFSFVIVFSRWRFPSHRWAVWIQALLLAVVAAVYYLGGIQTKDVIQLCALHLMAFFFTALVCHGEMANDRPAAAHLTEFYLWMSLGGVLGGLLNALVAPQIFRTVLEYPLMMVAACLLRPQAVRGAKERYLRWADFGLMLTLGAVFAFAAWAVPEHRFSTFAHKIDWAWLITVARKILSPNGRAGVIITAAVLAFLLQRRPFRFATAFATVLIVGVICEGDRNVMYRARSFYGLLRVEYAVDSDDQPTEHTLMHGSTMHGQQSLDPDQQREPWTYYHRTGPVGEIMEELRAEPTFRQKGRIGVVGLGTGTVAAYGLRGQHLTYFEIDPEVRRISENPEFFTYLTDCRERGCDLKIKMGDARLTLAKEPAASFDVLFIDAFSSDAIPLHLITREAINLYFDKLAPHGILMVHISNRHLNLEPVLGNVAEEQNYVARTRNDNDESDEDGMIIPGKSSSTWVALVHSAADLGNLDDATRDWKPAATDDHLRVWTDDFSNVVGVLEWKFAWKDLPGVTWFVRK